MCEFRVVRTLINGPDHRKSITVIRPRDMVDGDTGSYRSRRHRALEIVNEWNRMAAVTNTKNGVWHYYLLEDGEHG